MTAYNFTAKEYDKLYKRFISDARTEELVRAVECKNKNVLDLCAGSGRLSRKAIDLGACHVVALDTNPNVIDNSFLGIGQAITPVVMSVEDLGFESHFRHISNINGEPSVIYCQQAVNYWFSCGTLNAILRQFKNRQVSLAFNTFNKKPETIPSLKIYDIDGLRYVETWNLTKDSLGYEYVNHAQFCEGMEPHLTQFRWIDEKEYFYTLSSLFEDVKKIDKGNSTIWVASVIKKHVVAPWELA